MTSEITMTIKPYDRIKDNDPRTPNRVLTVREVRGQNPNRTYAVCTDDFTKREYRIRIDRIHTDGKPRRSGFTLLEPSHG